MAYTPKTWTTGETITAAELNAIEQAASAASTAADTANSGLTSKVNSSTYTAGLAGKADLPAGGTDGQALVKSGTSTTWATVSGGGTVSDASTTAKGVVQLAGDLAGTAAAPTVPGLAAKAPIASPTFTGTVSGVTAAMVGLGNVNNTSDASKPISTATQTALNAKLDTATAATTYVAKVDAIDLEGTQDSIAGMFTGGTHSGISFAYDDPNGHINATVTPGAVADATTTAKGAVQLAGDLAGTASAPTVPGLAGKLAAASNLSDVASAATARTNLGLGSAATQPTSAFDTSGAATSAQAFAIQRANHTGTQAASTITGLAAVATSGSYNDLTNLPTNRVVSTTVTTIVTLTAAAYTALGTKDAAILYVVTP